MRTAHRSIHAKIPSFEQRVGVVFQVWHFEFRPIIGENLETAYVAPEIGGLNTTCLCS
jgi:hypothetical protein